ncbi:MAG: hypothetical protein Q9217_001468 [Psora testacea]
MLQYLYSYPLQTISLLIFLPSFYLILSYIQDSLAIRKLGYRAPRVPNYLPFGIDIAYRSITHCQALTDLDFWSWVFSYCPFPHGSTAEFYVCRQRFLSTAEPENIKAILATQFADYGKGEPFHEDWKDFLGDGIFTTDGELWHSSRQLIRPQFVKQRVSDLDIFEKHAQKLMSRLGGRGERVDISSLFYRYTLDSATDYLLGHSVDSLTNPQAEFAEAFAEVQRVQSTIARAGPLNRFVPRKTFWAGLKVINDFVEPFIETVLRMDIADLKEQTNHSFLHALAATGTRDRKVIRDQCVAVLLAGRDTTAGALSFLFLELSRNRVIVDKLRREVLEKVGSRRAPTYEDLKNIPYLQHTLNEVLRLYPSVPFNVRMSLRDTTLPTGGGPDGKQPIGILKNTSIGYATLYMHRRPDLYPVSSDLPHPHVFSPERWEKWQPKPWQYIPFNGGPRICIGQQFALTEMGYTVVRILQRVERIDCYTADDGPKYKSEIVLSPAKEVMVGFWEATKKQSD